MAYRRNGRWKAAVAGVRRLGAGSLGAWTWEGWSHEHQVEVTYDMSRRGMRSFEVEGAQRAGHPAHDHGTDSGRARRHLEKSLGRRVSINGVLINHRSGMRTALADGTRWRFSSRAAAERRRCNGLKSNART